VKPELTPEQKQMLRDQLYASEKPQLSDEQKESIRQQIIGGNKNQVRFGQFSPEEWFKNIPKNSAYMGRGAAAGAIDFTKNTANYANKLADILGLPQSKTINQFDPSELTKKIYPEEVANTMQGKAGYLAGQIAPTLAIPGGPAVQAEKGFLGILPKASSMLKNFGYNLGVGEALSPIYNPKKSLSEAYSEGLTPSVAAASLGPALGLGKNVLGGLLRQGGTATEEELARNVAAAKELGQKIPLGQAAASPLLSGFQSAILSNTPGAGMAQHFVRVGKDLKNQTGNIIDSLKTLPEKNEQGETSLKQLVNSAKENYQKEKQVSRKSYENRNKYLEEKRINLDQRNNLKKTAEDIDNDIKRQLESNKNMPIDSQFLKDIEDAKEGNTMSFKDVNNLRDRYRQTAKSLRLKGDNITASGYERLLAAHNADIEQKLLSLNDQKAIELNNIANQHYAKKLAPVKENSILRKYLNGKGNPDLFIQSFSKGGWDQPELQKTIMQYLNPQQQRQYAGEFLSKFEREGYQGERHLKEDKILNNYENLGDETKNIIFQNAPEEKKKLDAINHIKHLYNSDLKQLINTKSGEKSAKQLLLYLSGLGALAGGEAYSGVSPGHIAAQMIAVPFLGRGATRYLTSPLSQNLYRKGLKLKGKPTKLPVSPAALLGLNQENQENQGGQ
jgi:hypothetical protein